MSDLVGNLDRFSHDEAHFVTGIRMLTLDVEGKEKKLIMEQLAYNPQVSYMQAAWDDLVVTERMIADINSCKYMCIVYLSFLDTFKL